LNCAANGLAAGTFSVVAVIIADDLMRGAGRFNLAQGQVALAVGVGAGLGNFTSGFVVERFGYPSGLLYLATITVGGLVFSVAFMPETRPADEAGAEPFAPREAECL
jgi:hypothetical protein